MKQRKCFLLKQRRYKRRQQLKRTFEKITRHASQSSFLNHKHAHHKHTRKHKLIHSKQGGTQKSFHVIEPNDNGFITTEDDAIIQQQSHIYDE